MLLPLCCSFHPPPPPSRKKNKAMLTFSPCLSLIDFSVRLCALYNDLSQVKVTPWDPDNTVHIDEIYTQLCWFRDDKRPSGIKQDKLADYCDIFKGKANKPNPDRILVYGRLGIGKSTFAQKISIDWARGKKEILKKFDLLLMIPLRNVCESETFHDLLQRLSITRDLQHKNVSTKPKFWWTSIISASLVSPCRLYPKFTKKGITLQRSARKNNHFSLSMFG